MNNPYLPNSTPIPHVLMDYWMSKLTDGEFKVLMAIARKTYGWGKSRDMISLSQIETMTGLSRKGVTNILKSLVNRDLIIKIKSKTESGDDASNQYEINVNCKKGVEIEEGGGRELSALPVGNSVHQGVVYSVHPQKQLYTKTTKQKREREKAQPSSHASKLIQRAKNVDTTEVEHQKLLTEHGEAKVALLYQLLNDWKEDTARSKWKKNDYRSILRWVVNAEAEKRNQKKSNQNCKNADRQLAEKIWNRCKNRKEMDIRLDYNALQFINGQSSVYLEFGSKDFRDKCLEQLRKRKLTTEGL